MSKLTPEREQFLRSYFSGNDPDSKKVSELFDEIDSLRHYAKSFNRNFAFMKQELEECEAKNRSLESQLMFANNNIRGLHEEGQKLIKVVDAARTVTNKSLNVDDVSIHLLWARIQELDADK